MAQSIRFSAHSTEGLTIFQPFLKVCSDLHFLTMFKHLGHRALLFLTLITAFDGAAANAHCPDDGFGGSEQGASPAQQRLIQQPMQENQSAVCLSQRDLVYSLEQLSWYVKGDCNQPRSRIGLQSGHDQLPACCFHAKEWCQPNCPRSCCPDTVAAVLQVVGELNEFYAMNFTGIRFRG